MKRLACIVLFVAGVLIAIWFPDMVNWFTALGVGILLLIAGAILAFKLSATIDDNLNER